MRKFMEAAVGDRRARIVTLLALAALAAALFALPTSTAQEAANNRLASYVAAGLLMPIAIFASMPAPWCYIGAAEVLQRLSFLVGGAFSPIGLRQGLRYIARAQAADPDNADALITRARLLASVSDPRWLKLA
jgi:hypothetical protein